MIEASRKQPVIVDFWAPWCGPCKQLGPALEKVVRQANGKVRMVKINVDENQQLAAQMRIQSIPAVFAFVNGQPVDGFMGALPESQLKQFVDRLGGQGGMAEEIEAAVAEARAADGPEGLIRRPRRSSRRCCRSTANMPAPAGLARCQIAAGDLENAQATLALVPPAKAADPEVLSAKAALDLALNPVDCPEIGNAQGGRSRRTPTISRRGSTSPCCSTARANAPRPPTSCSTSSARSATGTRRPRASSW